MRDTVVIEVAEGGAVSVSYGTGIRAMSRFSATAQTIAGILPVGRHEYVGDLFRVFEEKQLSSLGIIIRDMIADM